VGAGFCISLSETKYVWSLDSHVQDAPNPSWQRVTLSAIAPTSGELWIRGWFFAVFSGVVTVDDFWFGLAGSEPSGGCGGGTGSAGGYVVDWQN